MQLPWKSNKATKISGYITLHTNYIHLDGNCCFSVTTHPGKLLVIRLPVISLVVVELIWFLSDVNIVMETSALRELHRGESGFIKPVYPEC